MAGHFSLFKLSCTTYLRYITIADQMRVYLFAYSVSNLCIANLCIALSASASLSTITISQHRLQPSWLRRLRLPSLLRIYGDHVISSHRLRPCHFITSATTTSLHRIGCNHVTSSYWRRPRHFIISAAGTSLHQFAATTSSLRRLRLPSYHRLSITPSTAAVFTSSILTLHRQRLPFLLGTITSASAMTSCDTFFALSLGIRHHITPITFARVLCHLLSGQAGLGFSCWLAEQLVYSPLTNIQNHLQIS